jgi:iron complex outermembrane receptor protein
MNSLKSRIGFLVVLVLLFFITVLAMAEQNEQFTDEQEIEAKDSSTEETRKNIDLGTITVTAQKTEENIQDVPISTTLFDEFSIQDKMIDTVSDIARYTPGLEIISYGAALKVTPSIRGMFSDYVTRTSTAGLFVDGVPVTDGSGFDQTLLDIERIEVLKGPQGTLYGKNTEVGAVNIITKKPSNEARGKILVNIGEDDKREIIFNASGALVKDKFYIGVSGKHYEKDGLVNNIRTNETIDDREHNYGKINLRWTPTEDLEVSLMTSKIEYDDEANRSNLTDQNDREVSSDFDSYNRSEVLLSALNVSYNLNKNMSFSSITAYRDYDEIQQDDWDYSDDDAQKFHASNDSSFQTLSEELKLNYKSQNIKLVSGVFLEKGDMHIDKDRDAYWGFKTVIRDYESESIGLFSHLTYEISEKLSVLGGLRFDWETQDYEDSSEKIERKDDEVSPKIGFTYNLQKNLMLYTTVSKGYRSGGFNSLVPDGYSKTYDKESLYSYEVGLKGLAFNNNLKYDVALYYMDITDMQVNCYIDPANVIKTNAAEATSKGIEASLQLKLTECLSLFAGFSYNDIAFDEYNDGQEDYTGKRTSFSPEYNFNLGILYRARNGFYASADISGYGDMYLDTRNEYKRDPYELANAKIGYETSNYDIYLYAKNLFDKEYNLNGTWDGVYKYYSEPREIGLQFVYRI